jgi:hypothetical protein
MNLNVNVPVDVRVGTVHSRPHAARSDFQKALHRLDARSRTRSP